MTRPDLTRAQINAAILRMEADERAEQMYEQRLTALTVRVLLAYFAAVALLVASWLVMLTLGGLHHAGVPVPALGFWETFAVDALVSICLSACWALVRRSRRFG